MTLFLLILVEVGVTVCVGCAKMLCVHLSADFSVGPQKELTMAVRKKRDGYEVYYRDPVTGKQRSRFFETQKDAEKEDRRVKYMLEFEREKIIEEDAKRTPVPKPKPKPKPEPESKPALDPDRYLFKNVVKTFEEWRGYALLSDERYSVKKFLHMDVRTITRQTFSNYYLEKIRLGNKPQTVQRRITTVRSILRHAVNMGYIDSIPDNIDIPACSSKEFIPPTEDELEKLYSVAPHHVQRVIILGAYFGMRVGPCEMLSLEWSDIDMDTWVINLRAAKKNHREPVRAIPIPEAFRDIFIDWKHRDSVYKECITVVNYYGRKIMRLQRSWKSTLVKAGIDRELRPYDLRHAFATNGLRKGLDVGTLAKIMGHVDATMILRTYQHVELKDKANVMEKMAKNALRCMDNACMDTGSASKRNSTTN
ncbi:hypothetical protein B5F76_07560 [Desulfovibrio sp. An276]|nr:hypothetical protein B5F76_07560 [Desulfovibrio sp. An276]